MTSTLNIAEILKFLPHRYPFLLIDRIVNFEPSISIHAYKNVTINEPFFTGHFPEHPIMPGVLILESMAQAAGILAFKSMGDQLTPGTLFYFVGIDEARFRKLVVPGDQLQLHITVERQIRGIWKFKGEAKVDGEIAASATLMCAKQENK